MRARIYLNMEVRYEDIVHQSRRQIKATTDHTEVKIRKNSGQHLNTIIHDIINHTEMLITQK